MSREKNHASATFLIAVATALLEHVSDAEQRDRVARDISHFLTASEVSTFRICAGLPPLPPKQES